MNKEELNKYTKKELIDAIIQVNSWYGITISKISEEKSQCYCYYED